MNITKFISSCNWVYFFEVGEMQIDDGSAVVVRTHKVETEGYESAELVQ